MLSVHLSPWLVFLSFLYFAVWNVIAFWSAKWERERKYKRRYCAWSSWWVKVMSEFDYKSDEKEWMWTCCGIFYAWVMYVHAVCVIHVTDSRQGRSLEPPLLPQRYNSNPDGVQKFIPALDSRTTTFTLRPATTEVYSTSPLIREIPPRFTQIYRTRKRTSRRTSFRIVITSAEINLD